MTARRLQIVKITPVRRADKQVEEVYINDGKELSAGTVAAPSQLHSVRRSGPAPTASC